MESFAADLATMARTPLAEAHLRALVKAGETRSVPAGTVLVPPGARLDTFYHVTEGELEAIDPVSGGRYGDATLGPGQFFGELNFLTGGAGFLGCRVVRDSRLLAVPRDRMLRLMAEIPELSDIVVTVFAARRRRIVESREGGLTLVGLDASRRMRQVASFASRNRLPWRELALGSAEAADLAQACGAAADMPFVALDRGTALADPDPAEVARLLGLDLPLGEDTLFDVLIVGAGPAGVAAGVYAGAEGLSALVLEDSAIGGQAGTSSRIENYMGFPTGITGADLVGRGEIQALKFGTRFAMPRRATALAATPEGFAATLDNGSVARAKAVIVATGVQYRRMPLDRLEEFEGAGVYYAATELEARFSRDEEVAVIGGGNSAGQAAMFLSRSARHVHLVVRGRRTCRLDVGLPAVAAEGRSRRDDPYLHRGERAAWR